MKRDRKRLAENYINSRQWGRARRVLLGERRKEPSSHWVWDRIGATYYGEGKYSLALKCYLTALKFNNECALVRWDVADALLMLGHVKRAKGYFRGLIRRGIKNLLKSPCSEGEARDKGIIIDSHYGLAECFRIEGDNKSAIVEYKKFINARRGGGRSVYSVRVARIMLEELGKKGVPGVG